MLFYDYTKLCVLSFNDSNLLLRYLPDVKGKNFIVNENIVLLNPLNLSDRCLAEYIGILALRNYENYKSTRKTSLDMSFIPPWIPIQTIQNNPLIQQQSSKLLFKYEEI